MDRNEFASRLRAMCAYAEVKDAEIARLLNREVAVEKGGRERSKTVENWMKGKGGPRPREIPALAGYLAKRSLDDGRDGIAASFLTTQAEPLSAGIAAVTRQQLDSVVRAIEEVQSRLPPVMRDEQSQ